MFQIHQPVIFRPLSMSRLGAGARRQRPAPPLDGDGFAAGAHVPGAGGRKTGMAGGFMVILW